MKSRLAEQARQAQVADVRRMTAEQRLVAYHVHCQLMAKLLQVREAASLRRSFDAAGFITELRVGDPDDPIPALLAVRDTHGNRVCVLIGLRGLDPDARARAGEVAFLGGTLRIVGREDLIAMKVFAGGPQDLADARAALELDHDTLDLELLRRLSARFGRGAERALERLLAE